jgi:hypothetical protein
MNYNNYKLIENHGIKHGKIYIESMFHNKEVSWEYVDEEQDKAGIDIIFEIEGRRFSLDWKICENKEYYWDKYNYGQQDIIIEKNQYNGESWANKKKSNIWVAFVFPPTTNSKYKKLIMMHSDQVQKLYNYAVETNRTSYKTYTTNTYNWFFTLSELEELDIRYYSWS